VASFLKGISSALKKPLVVIDVDQVNDIKSDLIAKKALKKFIDSAMEVDLFEPKDANPTYAAKTQYKKINE
jgi:hypothetical protein